MPRRQRIRMMNHFYESIEGWFNFRSLYDLAVKEASDGAKFVEVGSWYGRSAAYLAVEIANSGKRIDLYCVDTWHGSLGHPREGNALAASQGAIFPAFRQNLQQGGIWELVKPICDTSVAAATRFPNSSLDFVMIDAAHDYSSVRDDVRTWLPKLKPGGLMGGDDATWPGVLIAVHETIPMSEITILNEGANWLYRNHRPSGGTWLYRMARKGCPDYLVCIPYVNRPDLLDRAVRSIRELWCGLIILDQSKDGLKPRQYRWLNEICGVFRVPARTMSFTQMMNWTIAEARQRGASYLAFMHNDAECREEVAGRVLEFARSKPHAGVVFTHYDAFAVFNVTALQDVGPWDETFRWYFADNDYYYRMKLRGWELADFGGRLVDHQGSQTIHSDPSVAAEVAAHWKWHGDHYQHKWGGPPNQERHTIPYGGAV